MSKYGVISFFLMKSHMMRVISSPSISTIGFATLILVICRLHVVRRPDLTDSPLTLGGANRRSLYTLVCIEP